MKIKKPLQCSAVRLITLSELLKFKILGPLKGFSPKKELRCMWYEGHSQYGNNNPRQIMHEDTNGHRWSDETSINR